MKLRVKRHISALCAAAMLFALLPGVSLAADLTLETHAALGRGLSVTQLNRKGDAGARQMFVLDYTPGGAVAPIVVYGDKLYGKSDIDFAVSYAEARGYTVLAAVNADYFIVQSGVPTGMVINNGRLCVSDGAWNAVGFFADGTAITGTPRMSISYYRHSTGTTHSIHALNKVRSTSGICLYTEDFSAVTRTTAAGTEVVMECAPGDYLRLGEPIDLTVVAISREPNTPIGPNQFIMSLTDANVAGLSLNDIAVGEKITITASTENPRWSETVYACGGGNILAADGVLTSHATASALAEPRTVLGVRPDGSVSILVCDGRQKGLSDGISLQEAAQILLARGCTDVINLDGGGSTAVSLRPAGEGAATLASSPSDGTPRKCANYILFVNSGDRSLPQSAVSVYPQNTAVLAGARLELRGLTYNSDFFATGEYTGGYYVSSGGGTISGSAFIAPDFDDFSAVDADGPLASTGASVQTVTRPAEIYFTHEGAPAKLTTLAVGTDSVTDLSMYATDGMRRIVSQDTQFSFFAEGGIGEIDENGVFYAVSTPGLGGSITAVWGDYVVTVPVTVGRAPQLLEDYEAAAEYAVTTTLEGSTASAKVLIAAENARYGSGALSLNYSTAAPIEEIYEEITFAAPQSYAITGGGNIISLMAKGFGDFAMDFLTPAGVERVPFTLSEQWQYVTVDVPEGASAVLGFSATNERMVAGAAYIDQMMLHFGSAAHDTSPPAVTNMQFDGAFFSAVVTDNYPLPVTLSMLRLTVDGEERAFEYDAATGVVSALLDGLAGGRHRVTLYARDYFYNVTRESIVFGEVSQRVFTDLEGHWGMEPVEYLRERGIFSADERFNPQNKVSNEMAATIISRYLNTDTDKYADYEMPYADGSSISDWAAPHVKAMYYEGIMFGSTNEAGEYVFSPQQNSTRAQVMTVLGRTIPRGYSYEPVLFDDSASVPVWAGDHISLLYALGIVNGYTGTNNILPLGEITRAEMASLLFKLY